MTIKTPAAFIYAILGLSNRWGLPIMERTTVLLRNDSELKEVIRTATVGFVGCFMGCIIHDFEKLKDKQSKTAYIKELYKECDSWARDEYDMRNKINVIIRIIESDMVVQAMEYVLKANSRKLEIPEIKENAKLVLEHLEIGKLKMPIFED